MPALKRVRFVARGRVQGVFFRDSVPPGGAPRRRGLGPQSDDGTVEGVFEGEGDEVDAIVEFCRAGPGELVGRVASR